MQPVRSHIVSHREHSDRDLILDACRQRIAAKRIPCQQIVVSGRPMSTAVRAIILRGEWDGISLRKSYLIADAVGVDVTVSAAA